MCYNYGHSRRRNLIVMTISRNVSSAPIVFYSAEEQQPVLTVYNQQYPGTGKAIGKAIPIVPRNFNSGWPLLQVSLYSPVGEGEALKYECVLGGGDCHYFLIGAFSLACLLTSIPGKKEMFVGDRVIPPEQWHLGVVEQFLYEFSFCHPGLGIKIISKGGGGYGKTLQVTVPSSGGEALMPKLTSVFSFAVPRGEITDIPGWPHDLQYTPVQISQAINPDVAIFHSGQIFVDLGLLLDKVGDTELKELFERIFNVAGFLALRDEKCGPLFRAAIGYIQAMPSWYHGLHPARGEHTKIMDSFIKKCVDITALNGRDKLICLIHLLTYEFNGQLDEYQKKQKRTFTEREFVDFLNGHKTDYHYARLLVMLINAVAIQLNGVGADTKSVCDDFIKRFNPAAVAHIEAGQRAKSSKLASLFGLVEDPYVSAMRLLSSSTSSNTAIPGP